MLESINGSENEISLSMIDPLHISISNLLVFNFFPLLRFCLFLIYSFIIRNNIGKSYFSQAFLQIVSYLLIGTIQNMMDISPNRTQRGRRPVNSYQLGKEIRLQSFAYTV